MIQTQLSKLQITPARELPTGLTESDHLMQAYLAAPVEMEGVLALAFNQTGANNILTSLTGGVGNVEYIDNRTYRWKVFQQQDYSVEILGLPDSEATPGIGFSSFRVRVASQVFVHGDVCVLDNPEYMVIAQSDGEYSGNGFVYTFRMIAQNPSQFIPAKFFASGSRISKDFTAVSEYSTRGGMTFESVPFMLENHLTTFRNEAKITRSAATDKLVIEMTSNDGTQKSTCWCNVAEWNMLREANLNEERMFMYSKFSKNPTELTSYKGENGRPIYMGAGLREQIAPSNVRFYNTFNYSLLEDFLMELSYNFAPTGGNRHFIGLTGKMGLVQFQRAMEAFAKEKGYTITMHGTFITGEGQNLGIQGQYTTVKFLNGITLTMQEFPPYDDIFRHRLMHPDSGKPVESYRYTFLNTSPGADGKSNIRKIAKRDSDNALWTVAGSMDPYAGVAKSLSTSRASSIDGYEIHSLREVGIKLNDPTSCGELILDYQG